MTVIKDFLKDLIMRIPICVFGNFLTAAVRS